MQSLTCSLQSVVCGLRSAVCGLRSAVCSLQSAVCKCQTPFEFSSILSTVELSETFNHGLNPSKIHTARQFCECLLFLFRQSSMVKPV